MTVPCASKLNVCMKSPEAGTSSNQCWTNFWQCTAAGKAGEWHSCGAPLWGMSAGCEQGTGVGRGGSANMRGLPCLCWCSITVSCIESTHTEACPAPAMHAGAVSGSTGRHQAPGRAVPAPEPTTPAPPLGHCAAECPPTPCPRLLFCTAVMLSPIPAASLFPLQVVCTSSWPLLVRPASS